MAGSGRRRRMAALQAYTVPRAPSALFVQRGRRRAPGALRIERRRAVAVRPRGDTMVRDWCGPEARTMSRSSRGVCRCSTARRRAPPRRVSHHGVLVVDPVESVEAVDVVEVADLEVGVEHAGHDVTTGATARACRRARPGRPSRPARPGPPGRRRTEAALADAVGERRTRRRNGGGNRSARRRPRRGRRWTPSRAELRQRDGDLDADHLDTTCRPARQRAGRGRDRRRAHDGRAGVGRSTDRSTSSSVPLVELFLR